MNLARTIVLPLMTLSLIAGLALPVQRARAQQVSVASSLTMGGELTQPLGKSDVERMSKVLKLNKDQETAVGLLLDGYLAEHEQRASEQRKAQEAARNAFREDRDMSVWGEVAAKMEAFSAQNAVKERELLENIKGVLEKNQMELWPAWERAHRRARGMNRGMLSGERADLVELVERLNLVPPVRAAVEPTLESYSVAMDRALVARSEAQKAAEEESKSMRDAFSKGGGLSGDIDLQEMMKKADEQLKKSREASIPVRDTNKQFARQIEGVLRGSDAAAADQFAEAFRRASFPDVYRDRYADKALSAAEKMEDLDAAQREAVVALKAQHLRDRKGIDESMERATEEDEANFSLGGIMSGGGGFMRMMNGSDAMQAARKSRRELDKATLDRLKTILGESLTAKLPENTPESSEGGLLGGLGGMRVMPAR